MKIFFTALLLALLALCTVEANVPQHDDIQGSVARRLQQKKLKGKMKVKGKRKVKGKDKGKAKKPRKSGGNKKRKPNAGKGVVATGKAGKGVVATGTAGKGVVVTGNKKEDAEPAVEPTPKPYRDWVLVCTETKDIEDLCEKDMTRPLLFGCLAQEFGNSTDIIGDLERPCADAVLARIEMARKAKISLEDLAAVELVVSVVEACPELKCTVPDMGADSMRKSLACLTAANMTVTTEKCQNLLNPMLMEVERAGRAMASNLINAIAQACPPCPPPTAPVDAITLLASPPTGAPAPTPSSEGCLKCDVDALSSPDPEVSQSAVNCFNGLELSMLAPTCQPVLAAIFGLAPPPALRQEPVELSPQAKQTVINKFARLKPNCPEVRCNTSPESVEEVDAALECLSAIKFRELSMSCQEAFQRLGSDDAAQSRPVPPERTGGAPPRRPPVRGGSSPRRPPPRNRTAVAPQTLP